MNGKRLGITTILGIIAGFLALWWMRATMGVLPGAEEATVVLSWSVLGFALGLSGWRVNWAVHGFVLGFIFSLPQAFAFAWNGLGTRGFWDWIVAGLVIGFLIELITVPVFHARRRIAPTQTPQPHAM
jgi:hypothetical protein